MKKETKIKIIYIVIAFCLMIFIALFYSDKNPQISNNKRNFEYTTEITTEEFTEKTTIAITTKEHTSKIIQATNNNLNVNIIRKDFSIKSSDNTVYGFYYYDLPYFDVKNKSLVNIEAINKINAYLKADYENWLNGESRLNFYDNDRGAWFLEQVATYLECNGEAYMAKNPFCYKVESELIFSNEDILSLKQYVYIVGGGPSAMATFGLTFDLKTGEVLSIDKLIDISADELKNKILDYISNHIKEYGNPDNYESNYLPYYEVYAPNENHDFKLGGGSKTVDLNYSYYYDGKYYYIITQEYPRYNVDGILKWNGNKNDNFEEFFRYFTYRRNGLFVTEKI